MSFLKPTIRETLTRMREGPIQPEPYDLLRMQVWSAAFVYAGFNSVDRSNLVEQANNALATLNEMIERGDL